MMAYVNPKSIIYFSSKNDLLKWIHSNWAINISVVIMYLIVDSIVSAFSTSLGPFNQKRKVSAIIESFWLSKKRLMLLILSETVFL